MQRQLRFRVYLDVEEVDKPTLIYPSTPENLKAIAFYVGLHLQNSPSTNSKSRIVEISQCTDILDINGVFIFDGDLLQDPNTPDILLEVIWDYEQSAFMAIPFHGPQVKDPEQLAADIAIAIELPPIAAFCQVIGNIYENPHLLINRSDEEEIAT